MGQYSSVHFRYGIILPEGWAYATPDDEGNEGESPSAEDHLYYRILYGDLKDEPVEIETTGFGEDYEKVLVLKEPHVRGPSTSCEGVLKMPPLPEVTLGEVQRGNRFCEEHGLPDFRGAGWLVIVSVG